jgi:antitoxin YefM
MDALTFSYAQQNLADLMQAVNDDHAPVIVTYDKAKPVVIMSLEDYQSIEETAYLLRNVTGARRLIESIEELRAGNGIERELLNDD